MPSSPSNSSDAASWPRWPAWASSGRGQQGSLRRASGSTTTRSRPWPSRPPQALNATYRERFGFPFIVALHRLADLDAVFSAFDARWQNNAEQETAIALDEIVAVIDGRVRRLVTEEATQRRAAEIDPNPLTSTSGD
jgi:hypothetical protein